ncbi:hypothetical protein P885DRAFT_48017 [Corynascus similis CBS 632.67]
MACPQTPSKPLTSAPARSLEPGDISLTGTAPPTVPTLPPRVGNVNQGLLERLSRECQLRRFNLVWVSRPSRNGRFKFDIILHNHIIKADSEFDTEHWAKMAVAEKALRVVKSWPVGCLPPPPDLRTSERHQVASMLSPRQPNATVSKKTGESDGGRGRLAVKQERSPPMTPGQERAVVSSADLGQKPDGATSHPKSMPTMAAARGDPAREQADLLEHVRCVMGISLPGATTDSPEVAKAFLEGLAVGARLAGARVSTFSFRGRSESPVRASPETYRARSPLHKNERLSPPPKCRRRASGSSFGDCSEPRPPRATGGCGDKWVHDRYHLGGP